MKFMRKAYYVKPLAVYLIVALMALSTFAGPAEAMFVPAGPHQHEAGASVGRAADLAVIQAALESRMIRQKLLDYGLSPEEAMTKVSRLSSGQIHELAAHTGSLQAGGDPADAFFGLVIVAVLVVVLVFLLQHRIEVR